MPQPISASAVPSINAGTLAAEQRAAIGSVAIHWARLEISLGLCFSKLSGADLAASLIAFQNIQARSKVDTVGALGAVALSSDQQEEFAALVKPAHTLSSKRNHIVHTQWVGTDKKGRAVCLILSGRLNGPSVKYEAWATIELEQVAEDLENLFCKFDRFLIDHGMWNGKSFE
jgi:hypothetical protein